MELLNKPLYDALKAAGSPEEYASAAAASVAEPQLTAVKLVGDIDAMKSDIATLKWLVGIVIGIMMAGFGLTLTIMNSRLAAIEAAIRQM